MAAIAKIVETASLEIVDTTDLNDNIPICNADFRNFHKICRFCLGTENLKSFFDMTYKLASVQNIIFDCLSLKVNPEDHLPFNLCKACIAELVRYYKFKKRCIQITNILQDAYDNRSITKSIGTSIQMNNSQLYSGGTENLIIKQEEIENAIFIRKDYIVEDDVIMKNEEYVPTVYNNNSFEGMNSANLTIKDEETEDAPIIQNDKIWENINNDYLTIKKEEIECTPTICNEEVIEGTYSHNWNINNGENKYEPTICNRNIMEDSSVHKNLKQKKLTQTGDRPYVCKCTQTFSTKATFISHMKSHPEHEDSEAAPGSSNRNLGRPSRFALLPEVQFDKYGHIIVEQDNKARRRCRQCKSTTIYMCKKCNCHLHPTCFAKFHNIN